MRACIDGRRLRSAASRARILGAAEELYATVGFHATSLRAVARQVGMSPAGVARHYSSKDALLADVLARVTGPEGDTVNPDLDPAEQAVHLLTSGLGSPGRARLAAGLAVAQVADVKPIGHNIADPPPEPTTREGQIMRAAAAIAETGFRGMSVRELAAGLDTTHSALLYHFTSKATLLEAVMDYRDQLVGSSWAEPVTPLDGLYNLYRRAVYNESHPDFIQIYSALSCEASDPSHPSHSYFRRRFEMLIGVVAMELSRLQVSGQVHAGLDPVAEAQWLGAMWDGLQLHGLYRNIPDTSDRVLRQLNTWTTLPLPRFEPAR